MQRYNWILCPTETIILFLLKPDGEYNGMVSKNFTKYLMHTTIQIARITFSSVGLETKISHYLNYDL